MLHLRFKVSIHSFFIFFLLSFTPLSVHRQHLPLFVLNVKALLSLEASGVIRCWQMQPPHPSIVPLVLLTALESSRRSTVSGIRSPKT